MSVYQFDKQLDALRNPSRVIERGEALSSREAIQEGRSVATRAFQDGFAEPFTCFRRCDGLIRPRITNCVGCKAAFKKPSFTHENRPHGINDLQSAEPAFWPFDKHQFLEQRSGRCE